jgi:phage tail sheath protein FI
MHESLKRSLRWAIDQGITRNLLEQIQASVNGFLQGTLRKQGAIIDGYCWPDDEENSDEEIMQGRVHFQFKWTPVYVAEAILFKSVLTTEYLKKLKG